MVAPHVRLLGDLHSDDAGRLNGARLVLHAFHRQLAEDPKNATLLAEALYEVTGRRLALAFEVGENGGDAEPPPDDEPASEEEIIELMKGTFDAREVSEE